MENGQTPITIVTPVDTLAGVLSKSLKQQLVQGWEDAWLDKNADVVADRILEHDNDIVVVGPDVDPDLAVLWIEELVRRRGRAVTFVGDVNAKQVVELTRAGATDFLAADAENDEWEDMIVRARGAVTRLSGTPVLEADTPCRVIAMVTPRGGAGRTTLASNLAVAMAPYAPLVLVDLDVQFGGVASALDLKPEHTLFEAAEMVRTGLDPVAMKVLLDRYADGPYVLSAPATLSDAEAMTSEDSASIIQTLTEMFSTVLLDCSGGLTEHTLTALSMATDVVLVGTPDTASLDTLRRTCDVMDTVGFRAERHLVLNKMTNRSKQAPKIFETSLGLPLVAEFPMSRNVAESFQRGVPFFREGSRDASSRGMQALADQFLGPAAPVIKQGLLRRR